MTYSEAKKLKIGDTVTIKTEAELAADGYPNLSTEENEVFIATPVIFVTGMAKFFGKEVTIAEIDDDEPDVENATITFRLEEDPAMYFFCNEVIKSAEPEKIIVGIDEEQIKQALKAMTFDVKAFNLKVLSRIFRRYSRRMMMLNDVVKMFHLVKRYEGNYIEAKKDLKLDGLTNEEFLSILKQRGYEFDEGYYYDPKKVLEYCEANR